MPGGGDESKTAASDAPYADMNSRPRAAPGGVCAIVASAEESAGMDSGEVTEATVSTKTDPAGMDDLGEARDDCAGDPDPATVACWVVRGLGEGGGGEGAGIRATSARAGDPTTEAPLEEEISSSSLSTLSLLKLLRDKDDLRCMI